MSNEIKREDGPNREFSTGAEKQAASGKGTPVLVPGDAVIEVAKHFEGGATIYGPRNWEKGLPLSEILNSLERHLQQEKMGLTDEPHARALAWNALVYLATKIRIENGLLSAELDDMPKYSAVVSDDKIKATAKILRTNDDTKEFKDTMTSGVFNDGKWFCSNPTCHKRGFSNVAPDTFYCKEHIDEWEKRL